MKHLFMKHFFLSSFWISMLSSASLEHITVNNQDFSLIKEEYDLYDSKGEAMKLYKEERNKNLTFVLHLILDDVTGGCSSKSFQKGKYKIEGSTITLYSLWTRRGDAYDLPYGARVQKYAVQSNGSVVFLGGKLYIEESERGHDNESGMEYLFVTPKNPKEREALEEYVESVERYYKGEFLFGAEAKVLLAEVKKVLGERKKGAWKNLNLKKEK